MSAQDLDNHIVEGDYDEERGKTKFTLALFRAHCYAAPKQGVWALMQEKI